MNSRPARSVVVTWTWLRSRCTCQVSLQRLMRRHPLPLTGSLGLVPPLQQYSEVLQLPAAHFAALRFLRWAIPSLRPLFVPPPGPGHGAVDQCGVARRYLQPPCSMEEAGSPKFPEVPLWSFAILLRPRCDQAGWVDHEWVAWRGPRDWPRRGLPTSCDFGAQSHSVWSGCLRFAGAVAHPPRKTRFRLMVRLYRTGLVTRRVPSERFQTWLSFSPELLGAKSGRVFG